MVKVFMLPVEEGDFLWIRYGKDKKSNILIDGGPKGFGDLYKDVLLSIYNRDEIVEAVIFTHIDNDHIQGALEGLANTPKEIVQKIVKRIYFNTCNAIQRELSLKKSDCAEEKILVPIWNEKYGVGEAITLLDVLKNQGLSDRLTDFVVAGQQYDFEDNVKIKIISPNEKELEKLAKEWKEESCKKREKDILYGVDSETHYKKDLDELKKVQMGSDSRVNNRSSIAFLFLYHDIKMLFLGDANPKICVDGAKSMGITFPCNVDLIKLSHHGSKANTSNRLLKSFPTQYYLVSTDGSGMKVPNKAVLAHLLAVNENNKEPVWLFCNYEWWEDSYHGWYFSENDKKKYLDTGRLKVCFLDENGVEIKGGVKVYGKCSEVG